MTTMPKFCPEGKSNCLDPLQIFLFTWSFEGDSDIKRYENPAHIDPVKVLGATVV